MRRPRTTHRLFAAIVALFILVLTGSAVWAHPLGNFTISRYSELTAADNTLSLLYIIDMAEIPTFQEQQLIDTDGDGTVGQAEANSFREQQAVALLGNLSLRVNGRQTPWTLTGSTLTFPPGQGDLDTMRLELTATAALPQGSEIAIDYADSNFEGRLGWREIVINTDGGQLLDSSVPTTSVSNRLQTYPADLLQAPLEVTTASVRFMPAGASMTADNTSNTSYNATAAASAGRFSSDEFGNLLSRAMDTPSAFAAVLALAFALGAAHALTPGHGKTIVGAYLVGSRGTAGHAALLGLTTTVTHTAGVFALGLLVLGASRYILPETLFPWLGVASGLMVAAIGFTILRGHISHWRKHREATGEDNYHFHFGFGHAHVDEAAVASHSHIGSDHHHTRGHDHDHVHAHNHDHSLRPLATDHRPLITNLRPLTTDNRPPTTDHVPAILTSGEPISMRGLLALGVSGGLIPCPSALVLMLSAVALGQVGTGLILILAFSMGLAAVLTAIGITMVYAGRALDRIPLRHSVVTQRLLPMASAAFITVAGSVIAIRALLETQLI